MTPWYLELGRVGPHQLAIEHLGRELLLCFDPPLGATGPASLRVALVQPGALVEVPARQLPARSLTLPWPRAPLDDLWLVVSSDADARRTWFEVPYGLCCSPGELRHAPQLGPPRAPPAGLEDIVMPWQSLRFKLGTAGGWQLAIVARQGGAGELELAARRADPGVPPPLALAASIGPRSLAIEPHEVWGTEPAPVHHARYRFPLMPLGARSYARLLVRSGASTFDVTLPTSLVDRSHRHAGRREVAR